jgi:predicted nucleic acid-binding protein
MTLKNLRSAIDDAIKILIKMMAHADSTSERRMIFAAIEILDNVATQIDNAQLKALNDTINVLRRKFAASTSSLTALHERAVELKSGLELATKGVSAIGSLANAVAGT